jgi:hypothetical protein
MAGLQPAKNSIPRGRCPCAVGLGKCAAPTRAVSDNKSTPQNALLNFQSSASELLGSV